MYNLPLILVVASILGGVSLNCQAENNLITLDLKSIHNGDLFYAQVQVGSDDYNQSFKLLLSTTYPTSWLPSIEMSPIRGYKIRSSIGYDQMRYFMRTIESETMWFSYDVHYDTMHLGPVSIVSQPFAVANPRFDTPPCNLGIDGMLGLSDGHSDPSNDVSLLYSLHKRTFIDHLVFSLYINSTAAAINHRHNDSNDGQQQQVEGVLVLGGIDTRYYSGEFKYANLHNNEQWPSRLTSWLNMSSIHLDWSRVDQEKLTGHIGRLGKVQVDMTPSKLLLESSLILFIGHNKILDYIHEAFIGVDKIIRDNFYVFKDCQLDNKPDIVFTLADGLDLTITPEDYVIEHRLNDRQICLSAFKPSQDDVWSFGTRFMRKYYTHFDYEKNRVGFAKPT